MSKYKENNFIHGFTLVELLVVIAILAVLVSVTFITLDPLARFGDTDNTKRWTDVATILNAIKLEQIDHKGKLLTNLDETMSYNFPYQIGTDSTGCDLFCQNAEIDTPLQGSCVSLDALVTEGYLPSIPVDINADGASQAQTHYYITKNEGGSFTVGACNPEIGSLNKAPHIYLTR